MEGGVIPKPNANGSINCDHLDAYVHDASKWKIGLYDDGIDYCAPYNCYNYGVENHSTMDRKKGPTIHNLQS